MNEQEIKEIAVKMILYMKEIGFLKEQKVGGLYKPYPLKVWSKHGEFNAGYYQFYWEEILAKALSYSLSEGKT